MISVATREPRQAKYAPPRPHPKLKLTRAQKAAAHRAETAARILSAYGKTEFVPLWRKHVVQPAITKALARVAGHARTDALPDNTPPKPLFDWVVTQQTRVVKSQSRLQQGTLGVKADAHSPRVQTALAKGRDDARDLITSASKDLDADLDSVLLDPANFGLRYEEIRDKLLERGNVSESRAELIARDQTTKTNAAVARAGHEDAGFTHYSWSTSMDERVRPEHEALEGMVFSYATGSPEGNPGDPVQCRCVAIPVDSPEEADED